MEIGKKLRAIRLAAGLSELKLARLAGVSQSTLSEVEHGKYPPRLDFLQRVCSVLGISLADLFSDQPATPVPPHLRPLLEAARDLTPEQVEVLVAVARQMTRKSR